MSAESFDFRLRKAMRLRNVGTCELARKVGIRPPVLSRLRSGVTRPTFETLCAIARELDTSIDWLVGLTNELRSVRVSAMLTRVERPLAGRCAASRDGDCSHSQCPQLRDGEPVKSGRHCPLDVWEDQS